MQTRRGRDGQTVGTALPGAVASLLPRLRKVKALKLALDWLPAELSGLAAPHEIKLGPAGPHVRGADAAQVNTLFIYTASATVSAIIDQRAAQLREQVNGQLPYPLVEAVRCEQANAQKITQQLNNLTLSPD
jgi:hypothetical protein